MSDPAPSFWNDPPGLRSWQLATQLPAAQITLPAEYVASAVELGYATTIRAEMGAIDEIE